MAVTATIVVGRDGSTTKGGRSSGVGSNADREKFLERRTSADCILIGGNTARNEPYQRTPVPVVVISHSLINSLDHNRKAYWWNTSPEDALARARKLFGENILVEAGPGLLSYLVNAGLIDCLELSVTDVEGGENVLEYRALLSHFSHVQEREANGTLFFTAQK